MSASLQIVVSNLQIAYTSGDVVRGEVVLQCNDDVAIGYVDIVFSGRGKTKLIRRNGQNRRVYRGRAPLFKTRKVLYQGHYTMKANRYTWPFEFTFPSHSDPACIEDTFEDDEGVWRRTGEVQPLPPSFNWYDNHTNNQGMVEYKLEAEMVRHNAGIFESSKVEAETELQYMPTRAQADPSYSLNSREVQWRLATLHLLPDKQELTFKEKMRSVFKSSELPNMTFVARIIYPTVTFARRPIPIQIAIVQMTTSPDVPEQPPVSLMDVSVKVKSAYAFRASGLWERTGQAEEEKVLISMSSIMRTPVPHVSMPDKIHHDSMSRPVNELPAAGTFLDLSKLVRGGLFTPDVCPTFSTFNVAVAHRLKIRIGLACAQKSFSFDVAAPLLILPPSSGRSPSSPTADVQPIPYSQIDNGEPQLPMYTRTSPNTVQTSEPPIIAGSSIGYTSGLPPYSENAGNDMEIAKPSLPSSA
jgi:Arrestin (or S-antigen), N-terminal domain